MNDEINREQTEKAYKERGNKVMNGISAAGAGLNAGAEKAAKNLETSKVGKAVFRNSFRPVGLMADVHSIATAKDEKEKFKAYYKMLASNMGATLGVGALGWSVLGAGGGAFFGSWLGSAFADYTADEAFEFYQNTKQVTSSFAIDLYVAYESLPTFTSKPYPKRSSEDVFKNLRCLQPTISQSPNLTNKNISESFKDTISSKTTQSPKDETLNLKNQISTKGQTMNPNFLTLLLLYILIH